MCLFTMESFEIVNNNVQRLDNLKFDYFIDSVLRRKERNLTLITPSYGVHYNCHISNDCPWRKYV